MISAQIRAQVRQRAQNACEYCHLHQDDSPLAALHVEHIIPRIHGGSDDVENLALACIDCNLHKGTNVITELFHPRRDAWEDHFYWQGLYLVGKTPTGRTTIRVLSINSEDQVALRSS